MPTPQVEEQGSLNAEAFIWETQQDAVDVLHSYEPCVYTRTFAHARPRSSLRDHPPAPQAAELEAFPCHAVFTHGCVAWARCAAA